MAQLKHETLTASKFMIFVVFLSSIGEGTLINKYLFLNRSKGYPYKVFKIQLTVEELRCLSISIRKFHTQTYQLHWNVSWNQDSFDNYFLE